MGEDEESEVGEKESTKPPKGGDTGAGGSEGKGNGNNTSTLDQAADSENEPPSDSNANVGAGSSPEGGSKGSNGEPSLKLPDIAQPELTGHDSERGPASARLSSEEGVDSEVVSLIAGAAAGGALESGQDPSTVLPELMATSPR